jgi:hypothetical protein
MDGGVLNGGLIAGEFESKVVAQFTGEIASRLNKASTPATAAESLSSQGLTDHAFETLLDIETFMFEATVLLNAASIVNRSERKEERSG